MLNIYLVLSTLLLLFLFVIWNSSDWKNTLIKFLILLLAIFGLIMSLKAYSII